MLSLKSPTITTQLLVFVILSYFYLSPHGVFLYLFSPLFSIFPKGLSLMGNVSIIRFNWKEQVSFQNTIKSRTRVSLMAFYT